MYLNVLDCRVFNFTNRVSFARYSSVKYAGNNKEKNKRKKRLVVHEGWEVRSFCDSAVYISTCRGGATRETKREAGL